MPGIWYQVDLRLDGRFVRGASLPGVPGIYMGQTNDVCWTFTNAMADVKDLFVERIEGDRYLFEGEWRPLETVARGDPGQGPLRARVARGPLDPPRPDRQRGCLGADDAEPLALRWLGARRAGRLRAGHVRRPRRSTPAASWWRSLEGHTSPASNLIWADRHGSIGYKLIGRLPRRRGGLPGPAEAGLDRRVRVGGDRALRGAAGGRSTRECGYLITANNRIVGDDTPTTSPAIGSTAIARGGSSS